HLRPSPREFLESPPELLPIQILVNVGGDVHDLPCASPCEFCTRPMVIDLAPCRQTHELRPKLTHTRPAARPVGCADGVALRLCVAATAQPPGTIVPPGAHIRQPVRFA